MSHAAIELARSFCDASGSAAHLGVDGVDDSYGRLLAPICQMATLIEVAVVMKASVKVGVYGSAFVRACRMNAWRS